MELGSKYFKRAEFACKCGCGFDTIDYGLVKVLEQVREYFGKPVTINSACRCKTYNKSIGSTDASQHVLGRASDISVKDTPPSAVADYAESLNVGGLGRYATFTHIDTRNGTARWNG